MARTRTQVSTTGLVDTKRNRREPKRRQWSEGLKRQIVAETQEPGSSVSIVARRHDVNANQLFKWRRERQPQEPLANAVMLPVAIVPEPARVRGRARRTGTIEIVFGNGARVSLRGEVSPETLRQVIELLR